MAAQLTLASPASQSTLTHWAHGSLNPDHAQTRTAAHIHNNTADNHIPFPVGHADFISKPFGYNKDTADSIYKTRPGNDGITNEFQEPETDKDTAKGLPFSN